MAHNPRTQLAPLSRQEIPLWWEAYNGAHNALLAVHDGRLAETAGLTHLCEERAWEAIEARRRAIAGDRPARTPSAPPRRP